MATPHDAGDFEPDRWIGYLIRRAAKAGLTGLEGRFDRSAMSLSQWVALTMVRAGIADNCADLARALGYNSGATTRLIDLLEERGLVERHRSCGDQRVVTVTLTDAGLAQLAAVDPVVLDHSNKILSDFTDDKVDTLTSLLRRLVAKLEEDASGRIS